MRSSATILLAAVILSSCEVTVKKSDDKHAGVTASKIRNGIEIQAKGVQVEQAFLLFEDGTLVPDENRVQVNQKVILRLITDGWKQKDGRVFLSASERVETSEGGVILDQDDLFGKYADGIAAGDAKYISLNVVITEVTRLFDYFLVTFRVADKLDAGRVVTGSYRLHI